MRRWLVLVIKVMSLLFLLVPIPSAAGGISTGTEAPFFRVRSGSDEEVTLATLRGKVAVILYETKDIVETSRHLKRELNKSYDELSADVKGSVVRIPVIDCSSAFWPFTGIWKRKLRENSLKEGLTLYGDWDGNMLTSYRMLNGKTNVVIIDKRGRIRYFESGKLDDAEITRIKDVMRELVYGE